MNTITRTLPFLSIVLFIAFTGCRRNDDNLITPDEFQTDIAYFKYLSQNNDAYADFDELSGDDALDNIFSKSVPDFRNGKTPLQPLKFRKEIVSFLREFSVDTVSDSVRILHIKKTLTGNFIIKGIQHDTDTVTITKPFTLHTYRDMKFHRMQKTGRMSERWKPYAITAGSGATAMAQDSFAITSLSMHNLTTGDSLTVLVPLAHWFVFGENGSVFHTHKHDSIKIRFVIESTSADTEIVFTCVGRGRSLNYHKRIFIPLVAQEQTGITYRRTYERIFDVHHGNGRFNSAFEVVSHNTLYDDSSAKLTSAFWSIPYRTENH
jgi:hypothetical protein